MIGGFKRRCLVNLALDQPFADRDFTARGQVNQHARGLQLLRITVLPVRDAVVARDFDPRRDLTMSIGQFFHRRKPETRQPHAA